MNAFVKFLLVGVIVAAIGISIQAIIPSSITGSIDSAFVYFLAALAPLDFVIPVNAVYNALQIFGNFLAAVVVFILVKWLVHIFSR